MNKAQLDHASLGQTVQWPSQSTSFRCFLRHFCGGEGWQFSMAFLYDCDSFGPQLSFKGVCISCGLSIHTPYRGKGQISFLTRIVQVFSLSWTTNDNVS